MVKNHNLAIDDADNCLKVFKYTIMIHAIALDDEPLALVVIKAFCGKTEGIKLQKAFTDHADAMKYLRKYPVDLLFLDVRMPTISGIEFYKSVKQDTMVIFTTAYSEYAVEGFDLSAVDYLVKPIQYDRFLQAVKKAEEFHNYLHRKEDTANQYLFLRIDYSLVKLAISDIIYIEGLDNYMKIYVHNGKPLIVRMSMKAMIEKLPPQQFVRVHRSYIVSVPNIVSVRNKQIQVGGEQIPIGVNYEEAVEQLMKR